MYLMRSTNNVVIIYQRCYIYVNKICDAGDHIIKDNKRNGFAVFLNTVNKL